MATKRMLAASYYRRLYIATPSVALASVLSFASSCGDVEQATNKAPAKEQSGDGPVTSDLNPLASFNSCESACRLGVISGSFAFCPSLQPQMATPLVELFSEERMHVPPRLDLKGLASSGQIVDDYDSWNTRECSAQGAYTAPIVRARFLIAHVAAPSAFRENAPEPLLVSLHSGAGWGQPWDHTLPHRHWPYSLEYIEAAMCFRPSLTSALGQPQDQLAELLPIEFLFFSVQAPWAYAFERIDKSALLATGINRTVTAEEYIASRGLFYLVEHDGRLAIGIPCQPSLVLFLSSPLPDRWAFDGLGPRLRSSLLARPSWFGRLYLSTFSVLLPPPTASLSSTEAVSQTDSRGVDSEGASLQSPVPIVALSADEHGLGGGISSTGGRYCASINTLDSEPLVFDSFDFVLMDRESGYTIIAGRVIR